jgi:hypothetical protein
MMMKPSVLYVCEKWAMTEMDVTSLGTWERKMSGTHGPVVEQGMWIIRTNRELRELYNDLDIVADI